MVGSSLKKRQSTVTNLWKNLLLYGSYHHVNKKETVIIRFVKIISKQTPPYAFAAYERSGAKKAASILSACNGRGWLSPENRFTLNRHQVVEGLSVKYKKALRENLTLRTHRVKMFLYQNLSWNTWILKFGACYPFHSFVTNRGVETACLNGLARLGSAGDIRFRRQPAQSDRLEHKTDLISLSNFSSEAKSSKAVPTV